MNILKYVRNIQKVQGKGIIKIAQYAFAGILALSILYGMAGVYQYGISAPMVVLEFNIKGNYSDPIIVNATLNMTHARTAQIPHGEMDMPIPGVGVIVYNNLKRASYSSAQRYTGPGHYSFEIGFNGDMPQYNDSLTIAVHFFDELGRFNRAQIFTKWRWDENDY